MDFSRLKYYDPSSQEGTAQIIEADLCIYGGTSAGVAAALQASRMGLNVVIAEFGTHLGGITAGGLSRTDAGRKAAVGGISLEFYRELGKHYGSDEEDQTTWFMEPHVAEQIFNKWVDQANVRVFYKQYLAKVVMNSGKITKIVTENGSAYIAKVFIDATYEGDLMARAGVSYHVGREANAVYKETWNGIAFGSPNHTFKSWIDPYVVEGKPDSGLLPGIMDAAPGIQGQGDSSIQAYNFRLCLTKDPGNRVPFPQPPGYNRDQFALLARYINSGIWDVMNLHVHMQKGKTDMNNFGAVSTDHIGANHGYPEGSYAERENIFQDHVHYNLGMMHFLANDDSIPREIREEVSEWGLPADEFTSTGHWPHTLYIREARRMISDVVMTQWECLGIRTQPDSIGLGSYGLDSHNCRRIVLDGRCVNEGNVEIGVPKPYAISYRSIVPKGEECTNLLVPICLSASHIAYGSIRMEPVFMILGQSAATAAALALQDDIAVQELDYDKLKKQLIKDGQKLQ